MQSAQELQKAARQPLPRRAVGLLIHWLIKLVVLSFLLAWRFRPVTAVVLIAVVAFWWAEGGSALFALSPQAADGNAPKLEQFSTTVASVGPAPAPEQYLKAQSEYNAQGMWSVISDDMKRSTTARSGGMTLQRIEQQLEETKRNGIHYGKASFVGGYLAPDGRGFYLYVVTVSANNATQYLPFTFTVGTDGKILSID